MDCAGHLIIRGRKFVIVWLVVSFTAYLKYRGLNGGIIAQQLKRKNLERNKSGTTVLLSQYLPPETEEIH
jgi:hypothetical protein